MSENNQIQEISKLIASLFSQGFKPEFDKFLADKNIPFANQTYLYIQRLFNSVLNIPNVEIISYDFNGSDITVKLSGPFKSYVNVNGKDANFSDEGIATVTVKNAKVSPQYGIFLNLLIQSTPFKSEKDSSLAFDSFSKDENIGGKSFDLSYEQKDRLYKFLISKKIYNDDPSNILKAEILNNKIIVENTAPFDIYINDHKIEKKSKIEIPLTIKDLLNSGVTYSGYINDWDNRQLTNETYSSPSSRNFDSLVIQKFNELFDKTRDYDQDGLYFDKDAVIRGYNVSNINLKKKLEFKNNNPIKYYIVNRYGVTSGQVTKEDLKDVVAYQCPSTLETYLYDSTGKKKFIYNGSVEDGIIIFDVGE